MASLVIAGIFCSEVYAVDIGTLNPGCSPTDSGCTVPPPLVTGFSTDFTGTGDLSTTGSLHVKNNNTYQYFGSGDQAKIFYNGVNLVIDTGNSQLTLGYGLTGVFSLSFDTTSNDGSIVYTASNKSFNFGNLSGDAKILTNGLSIENSSGTIVYSLPTTDGTSGQVLSTNGSGVLSWANASIADTSGLVPYTGATTNVNLGSHDFTTTGNVGIGTDPSSAVVLNISKTGAGMVGIISSITGADGNSNTVSGGAFIANQRVSTASAYGIIARASTNISDPAAFVAGLFLNSTDALSDANKKRWTLYNATDLGFESNGKMYMGRDSIKTYWGTNYEYSIYGSGGSLFLGRESGTGGFNILSPVSIKGNLNFSSVARYDILPGSLGTSFGASDSLLSFYGSAPITKPSGNALTALANLGLVTSPTLAQANVTGLRTTDSPTFAGFTTGPMAVGTTINSSVGINLSLTGGGVNGVFSSVNGLSGNTSSIFGGIFLASQKDVGAPTYGIIARASGGLSNPTALQVGLAVSNTDSASDSNMKKWAFYNTTASGFESNAKMYMGIDDIKTYWGTNYEWSVRGVSGSLFFNRESGTGNLIVNGPWVQRGGISFGDSVQYNITPGTSGTSFGSSPANKISFYGATPIVQPASTTDLKQAMVSLGLVASGGATPLNLNGGNLTTTGTISGATLITGVESESPSGSCANGSIKISASGTTPGIYYCYGGAWHYSDQTSGFQIPRYESTDPITGERMQVGDFVIPMVDEVYEDGTAHGVWAKWSTVKSQLLAEARGELSASGTLGAGEVSGVSSETLLDRVANVLSSLGVSVKDGITSIAKLAVESFSADIATVKYLQMVAPNGDIYCTWIDDSGNIQKVKGECNSDAMLQEINSEGNSEPPSETSATDEIISQSNENSQKALDTASEAKDVAKSAQHSAEEAKGMAESALSATGKMTETISSALEIVSVNSIPEITIIQGAASLQLPETVSVVLSDGIIANPNVEWDAGAPVFDADTVGVYLFSGKISVDCPIVNKGNLIPQVTVNVVALETPAPTEETEENSQAETQETSQSQTLGGTIQTTAASLITGAWNFIEWIFVSTGIERSIAALSNGFMEMSFQVDAATREIGNIFRWK